MNELENNNLLIYKNEDGNIIVDAIFKDETLWLTQKGMSKVFDVGVPAISKQLNNIFNDGELDKNSVVSKMEITASDNKVYNTDIYNLDAIIAVGYRINSKRATDFRIWATKILKEYMIKGFALNDERFIRGNKYDAKYFDELLERIKTIRVSERMSYQKITDLFIATSIDYNSKSEEAYTFFKIVQNKLHFAISGHTAAELIFSRADSNKEHMGLTNWKNSPDGLIYKYDVSVAKNYLNKEELNKLNDLTNMFLVFAEDEAKERHVMTMNDWINATDDLLKFRRKQVLNNSENISHKQAVEKAESEYEKYRVIQDQKYISSMDEFYNKYIEENKNNIKYKNYQLVNATEDNINILTKYKLNNIFEYAVNLSTEEVNRIKNYVVKHIPMQLNNYRMIIIDNNIVGCLLVENKDNGVLLDEIYIEQEYRNKGIGTDIIKQVLFHNKIVYLWVYKANKMAISLYKKLNFNVIEETDSRYYMKYETNNEN